MSLPWDGCAECVQSSAIRRRCMSLTCKSHAQHKNQAVLAISHRGCAQQETKVATVQVWDAGSQIRDLSAAHDAKAQRGKRLPQRPMHMHAHSTEGYALDWSSVTEGRLASGDCRRGIHVWDPNGSGSWTVSGAYAVRPIYC